MERGSRGPQPIWNAGIAVSKQEPARVVPTVLVVEDTAIAREPLVKLLQYEGYNAVGVGNGQEALDALPVHHPDVVLLDILMPVMNGLEFLSTIRTEPRWAEWRALPVIVLTAVRDDVCERDVRNLGVQGFILKTGFSLNELLGMIRGQLRQ
jgi:CheY-like chemotaxis protein